MSLSEDEFNEVVLQAVSDVLELVSKLPTPEAAKFVLASVCAELLIVSEEPRRATGYFCSELRDLVTTLQGVCDGVERAAKHAG